MAICVKRGKHYGDEFERLIALQAGVSGMLLVVHGLQARYIGRGKIVGIKSDLDMRLHYQGRTAVLDAKSRAGNSLPLSSLDARQRALVQRYAAAGLVAGFICEHRVSNQICWYSARAVAGLGQRGSLGPSDGVLLGGRRHFALALMFA